MPTTSADRPGAPSRSLIQRQEAIVRANEVRVFRAELKKDLKYGRAAVQDYIRKPPELIETMKIFDLLLAVPKYGRVKVNRLLVQCRISPSKTVGGLSNRQRTELLASLRW